MHRREVLKASAGAAFSLAALTGCRIKNPGVSGDNSFAHVGDNQSSVRVTDQGKLAGLTLPQLRDQYRRDLFEDFLPFMDKYIIDHEIGGFMCHTDRDGTNLSTKKNVQYLGRGVWVYSFLYKELAAEEKYRAIATQALGLLLKNQPQGNHPWPEEINRIGAPIEPEGQQVGSQYIKGAAPKSDSIITEIFVATGLAEYGRAFGQERYWQIAKEMVLQGIKKYDQADYSPGQAKVFVSLEASNFPGARHLGNWMMLLWLGSQMLNYKADKEIEAVLNRCIDAIFNYHYNPEYNLFNELLNHDLSRAENEYRHVVYTGHGIETLWMVMYEAYRRKDKKLFHQAAELFKRHIEVAWDDVYGGFFRGAKNIEDNIWFLDKALYVQEEALIGLLFIMEHTGAQWAKDWFAKSFTLVQDKYPLKKHGYALWDLWPDRKFTFVEHYHRIGNFHHPRHLMLGLLTIERMIQRNGKVSNYFS